MKKSLIVLSTFALFAGAAMAAENYVGGTTDGSDSSSINNTLTSGEYGTFIGGNSDSTGTTGTGDVNGNIVNNVKNTTVNGNFVGGNWTNDALDKANKLGGVSGSISNTLGEGTVVKGKVYGGNLSSGFYEAQKDLIGTVKTVNTVVNGAKIGGWVVLAGGEAVGRVEEYASLQLNAGSVGGSIYGGFEDSYVGGNVWIHLNAGTVGGSVYAGGATKRDWISEKGIKGNTYTYVNGTTVAGDVYAGGWDKGVVEGMGCVQITGGSVSNVYGGGVGGSMGSSMISTKEGGVVNGNIYGGGINDTVKGNTQIEIYGNSDIKGDIYGGGKGADSKVLGNSSIRFVSNSNFTGTVDGAGQDGGTVAGTRILTFGGWQNGDKWDGDFNGKIKNINSIVLTNGSNVSNLKFDMAEPMSFGGEGTLEVITNLDGKNIDSKYLVNVTGSAPLDITFKNSAFSGNEINNKSYGVFLHWGAGKMAFDGTTIENNTITRNDGEKIQGMLYYNGSGSGEVVNTVLKNNTVSATQVQSSGVFAYKQNLDIKGSQFIGNKSIGSNGSKLTNGAVYVENQSDTAKIVNISDTLFDGNSAENTGEASMGKGGALAVVKRFKSGETLGKGVEVVLNDAAFTNNSAGMGGAIYVGGETLALNATKSATFSGNTATNGGFLYMDNGEAGSTASAKVSLNVADGATLTIGTTGGASDSIAGVESATLSKLGAGSLNVNGSMADFKGSLIVSAGVMNANNGFGAKSVSIANGATLGVALGNGALKNASVANNGTLSLKRGTLADGATFVLSNYSGEGAVKAYGGILSGGTTFTAGKSESFVSSAITVGTGANDVQSVKLSDKLSLDFDVSGLDEAALSVNEIKASTDLGGIKGDVLAAFDVDLSDNGNTYSVVFSAHVGAVEDASKLLAWHKGADGVWTKLDTAIDYADEIASIMVDGFSSYAFSQIPEPSTYAAILGVLALGLAVYRRRK